MGLVNPLAPAQSSDQLKEAVLSRMSVAALLGMIATEKFGDCAIAEIQVHAGSVDV